MENPEVHEREVFFNGWVKAPVYLREQLPMGYRIKGPALILEDYSTLVIPPRWVAIVGKYGVIEVKL
jgi:N-methylhydantoinase A